MLYCQASQTYTHVSYEQKKNSKNIFLDTPIIGGRLQSEFLVALKDYAYYRGGCLLLEALTIGTLLYSAKMFKLS